MEDEIGMACRMQGGKPERKTSRGRPMYIAG
jgi:hypothetical protein